jgi:hypothetical protein
VAPKAVSIVLEDHDHLARDDNFDKYCEVQGEARAGYSSREDDIVCLSLGGCFESFHARQPGVRCTSCWRAVLTGLFTGS